jgi:outer membrane receptor protein involved in Fe transport
MRHRLSGASVLAMAVAQLAWLPARAQTTPPTHGIEEVIVTAQKRSQSQQKVPMSVEVLDSRKLAQLQVNEFQDYIKYLPSVTTQTAGPNQTSIYMRGVSSGDNANHSGPLPTVGTYFDEFPTTTIGGNLDIHIYDTARIEALPGPQGTLFGASSESGTLRVISNPPNPAKFEAGYDLQGNVVDHGGLGGVAEGFVNIPITDHVAIRLVGFDEHDAGYIDNIYGTRSFATSTSLYGPAVGTINNSQYVKNDFNPYDTVGGRASLRVELPDGWTITPATMFQDQRANGTFFYAPSEGYLDVQRFQPDTDHDKWIQSGVTVQGKVGNFDLTYAGGFFVRDLVTQSDYTDYSIYYDAVYGSGAFWQGANGQPLPHPQQEIQGKDHFTKESNELRLASPSGDRLRLIVGGFQEVQQHRIIQDYQIQGFAPALAVPGWPNTIWLTDQLRTDRDEAVFGELSYDVLPDLTLTGGVRPYWYRNSLIGFFGFSEAYDALTGYDAGEGATGQNCKAGLTFDEAPCVDLNKTVSGNGETHKINATYRIDSDKLVYFTYSTGYRPGGVNRNANFGGYQADSLTNYELGFKSTWLDQRFRFNAALYDEDWSQFQFSFLGPNSLTIIENAPSANIKGAEFESIVRATDALTFSGGTTLTDAKLSANFCGTNPATNQLETTCSAAAAQAPSGTQLPYTPSFKGNITTRYTFDLFSWNAFLQASGVYQTRTQVGLRASDKLALGSMPAYGSADLSAGISKNHLSFSLFVKNAFDNHGQQNRFVECTTGVCQTVYVVPIQPLTVGFRLSQTF